MGGAASSIAGDSSDGVIAEVASHQQSEAAGGKEHAEKKTKVFWMRDPSNEDWIPKCEGSQG